MLEKRGFQFSQFEEVVPFCEPNGPDVDINNRNSLDNSGSNETMQKVLIFWGVPKFENWNFFVFHPI